MFQVYMSHLMTLLHLDSGHPGSGLGPPPRGGPWTMLRAHLDKCPLVSWEALLYD